MKKERTFLNWLKWNLRGRPKCLIIERGGRVAEHNVYVPDYLVNEYWRTKTEEQ